MFFTFYNFKLTIFLPSLFFRSSSTTYRFKEISNVVVFKQVSKGGNPSCVSVLATCGQSICELVVHYFKRADQQRSEIGAALEMTFRQQAKRQKAIVAAAAAGGTSRHLLQSELAMFDSSNYFNNGIFTSAVLTDMENDAVSPGATSPVSFKSESPSSIGSSKSISTRSIGQISRLEYSDQLEELPSPKKTLVSSPINSRPNTGGMQFRPHLNDYTPPTTAGTPFEPRRPPSPDLTFMHDPMRLSDPEPSTEVIPEPGLKIFVPSSMVSSLKAMEEHGSFDGLFSVASPPFFAMRTYSLVNNKTRQLSELENLKLVTRKGIVGPSPLVSISTKLDMAKVGIAFRASLLAFITELKEIFIAPLTEDLCTSTLLQIEMPVAPTDALTCLSVADICIVPSASMQAKHQMMLDPKFSSVLTIVGDSLGMVRFSVSTAEKIARIGSLRAHSAPITAVVFTGDAAKPMWKIGAVEAEPMKSAAVASTGVKNNFLGPIGKPAKISINVSPISCPGSAMLTIARDGEVKIWQPVFESSPQAKARAEEMLVVFELNWRMTGMLS